MRREPFLESYALLFTPAAWACYHAMMGLLSMEETDSLRGWGYDVCYAAYARTSPTKVRARLLLPPPTRYRLAPTHDRATRLLPDCYPTLLLYCSNCSHSSPAVTRVSTPLHYTAVLLGVAVHAELLGRRRALARPSAAGSAAEGLHGEAPQRLHRGPAGPRGGSPRGVGGRRLSSRHSYASHGAGGESRVLGCWGSTVDRPRGRPAKVRRRRERPHPIEPSPREKTLAPCDRLHTVLPTRSREHGGGLQSYVSATRVYFLLLTPPYSSPPPTPTPTPTPYPTPYSPLPTPYSPLSTPTLPPTPTPTPTPTPAPYFLPHPYSLLGACSATSPSTQRRRAASSEPELHRFAVCMATPSTVCRRRIPLGSLPRMPRDLVLLLLLLPLFVVVVFLQHLFGEPSASGLRRVPLQKPRLHFRPHHRRGLRAGRVGARLRAAAAPSEQWHRQPAFARRHPRPVRGALSEVRARDPRRVHTRRPIQRQHTRRSQAAHAAPPGTGTSPGAPSFPPRDPPMTPPSFSPVDPPMDPPSFSPRGPPNGTPHRSPHGPSNGTPHDPLHGPAHGPLPLLTQAHLWLKLLVLNLPPTTKCCGSAWTRCPWRASPRARCGSAARAR